jgi:hypothetical protein
MLGQPCSLTPAPAVCTCRIALSGLTLTNRLALSCIPHPLIYVPTGSVSSSWGVYDSVLTVRHCQHPQELETDRQTQQPQASSDGAVGSGGVGCFRSSVALGGIPQLQFWRRGHSHMRTPDSALGLLDAEVNAAIHSLRQSQLDKPTPPGGTAQAAAAVGMLGSLSQ